MENASNALVEQVLSELENNGLDTVEVQQEIAELEAQGFISGEKCWTCSSSI